MVIRFIILFLVWVLPGPSLLPAQSLLINEWMSKNEGTVVDEDGDSPDWIELYHGGPTPVNLGGWALSDKASEPFKWVFADSVLQPGEWLLVFASGKDRQDTAGIHTNFKIQAAGERVYLVDPQGNFRDQTQDLALVADRSHGRLEDGGARWGQFFPASPGYSNLLGQAQLHIGFSHEGGIYEAPIELRLSPEPDITAIRYTLDGSRPDSLSPTWNGPLSLSERRSDSLLSDIPTSYYWENPKEKPGLAWPLSVAGFREGRRVTPIYVHTYFIGSVFQDAYTFPVFSLVLDPASLFNPDSGIYVQGVHFDPADSVLTGNFFQKGRLWEKDLHVEFFETDGEKILGQHAGVRISGALTRNEPQKSLRLYARSEYGKSRFAYPFFENESLDSFKRLVLRTPSAGWLENALFQDEIAYDIVKEMDLEGSPTRGVIVFINGEYWGIHHLRERLDEHYLSDHFQIDKDTLDLLNNWFFPDHGNSYDFRLFRKLVAEGDIQDDSVWAAIQAKMDLRNFINYYLAEMYFANRDWPHNNLGLWKPQADETRFRWIFYDLDAGWLKVDWNMFQSLLDPTDPRFLAPDGEPIFSVLLFNKLMSRREFRQQFFTQAFYHLSHTFSPQRMRSFLDKWTERYDPEVETHARRWPFHPVSYVAWRESLARMYAFADQRACNFLYTMQIWFEDFEGHLPFCEGNLKGLPYTFYPNPSQGELKLWVADYLRSERVSIRIFDMQGKQVFTAEQAMPDGYRLIIPMPDAPGMYAVQVQMGEQILTEKVLRN